MKRRAVSPRQLSVLCSIIGAVRCANRLIINNDLDKGSQITYIERAIKEGFEVVVLNTNLNKFPDVARDSGVTVKDVPVTRTISAVFLAMALVSK